MSRKTMSKRLEAQLKPCPRCGGKAKLKVKSPMKRSVYGSGYESLKEGFIRCERCHARTSSFNYQELGCAIADWNIGRVS